MRALTAEAKAFAHQVAVGATTLAEVLGLTARALIDGLRQEVAATPEWTSRLQLLELTVLQPAQAKGVLSAGGATVDGAPVGDE